MKELQTLALGLIVVFVDLPLDGADWVADPLGWLLVLVGIAAVRERLTDYGYLQVTAWVCLALSVVTWPADSVPHLDDTLEWVFTLPTLAFCYLLADSLSDVTVPGLSQRFRGIAWVYALVSVLPLLVILAGWAWLDLPTTVLTIGVHVVLVLSIFGASAEDAVTDPDGETADADAAEEGRHKA